MGREDAIRRLTFMPAVRDRGMIREGMAADLVVFYYDRANWPQAEWFYDFPGGEGRPGNRATGIEYLIVNGKVVFDHGQHTGVFPGTLLRSTDHRTRNP